MDYLVRHRTTYRYLQEVSNSQHLLHLEPRSTLGQRVQSSTVTIAPAPRDRVKRRDAFGNLAEWVTLDVLHTTLEIFAQSWVTAAPAPAREPQATPPWEEVRAALEKPEGADAVEAVNFLFDSPHTWFTVDIPSYARDSFKPGRPMLEASLDLMHRIYRDFRYDTAVTDVSTPVDRVFEIRAGVCQDLAHLGIACLRSLGLPARYVSGYLLTRPPPGQQKLQGADASHAWFSVWCPPFGWVDLDPTNDLQPGEEHVTVAWGRDYADVAPINGVVVGGGDHSIEVGVDVIPRDFTLPGAAGPEPPPAK